MDPDYWLGRWDRREVGWHQPQADALLVAHFQALALGPGRRVFVPLCGKTRDIAWLRAQGHRVVAAELSEQAIRELFDELGIVPVVTSVGAFVQYRAEGIDVFVGDVFALTRDLIGAVDAIYDRAALFAMPPDLRDRYVAHLVQITGRAPQFLNCFEYDPSVMRGPPFSIDGAEVARLYGARYTVTLLDRIDLAGGIRGRPATDAVWLLR